MNRCNDYEIELSALIDGESDPAMALELVAHVAECAACSSFVRELRATQDLVDKLQTARSDEQGSVDVVPISTRQKKSWGFRPQWAVGIAALLVITVSLWFGSDVGAGVGLTNDLRDGELVIRLEENKGRMSDERFVALVSELLQADRRYQNEMYVVLDEIANHRSSGESRFSENSSGNEEFDYYDRSESSSPLNAAKE